MELQSIAEEAASASKAAVASAAEAAQQATRKVVIACGKPSDRDDSDTAVLVAFATQRVLRRTDLLAVVHVDEVQTMMCVPPSLTQPMLWRVRGFLMRQFSQRERRSQARDAVSDEWGVAGVDARAAEGVA